MSSKFTSLSKGQLFLNHRDEELTVIDTHDVRILLSDNSEYLAVLIEFQGKDGKFLFHEDNLERNSYRRSEEVI